jgi:hypothetical protein
MRFDGSYVITQGVEGCLGRVSPAFCSGCFGSLYSASGCRAARGSNSGGNRKKIAARKYAGFEPRCGFWLFSVAR